MNSLILPAHEVPAELKVRGRKETMHEYFASKGGPTAYLGSCIPGFPNCFVLLGTEIFLPRGCLMLMMTIRPERCVRPCVDYLQSGSTGEQGCVGSKSSC